MTVGDIMTKNPVTAQATATVGEVLETLYELDARHLPILNDGQLAGIVSDRDLRSYAMPSLSAIESGESASGLETPISEVMSGDVVSVEAEAAITEVIDVMLEERVGAVPVVDAAQELVGIISYVDILRAVRPSL